MYEWEGGDWQCHVCRPLEVRFGWVELRQLNPAWGVDDPSLLQEERVTTRAEAAAAERVRRIGERLANARVELRWVRRRGGDIQAATERVARQRRRWEEEWERNERVNQ